jgi:GntR family transcriptional regulator, vanillate catabolism transcriptional regulator
MSKPGQQVLAQLRQQIASGRLAPGARVVEIPTAEALGVSRMPVRMALRVLEREGLLEKAGARGYQVRVATRQDIIDGVEVRGVLEGLAARRAGERGVAATTADVLRRCLADGDAIFAKGHLTEADLAGYQDMNIRFHTAILEAGGGSAIREALARNDHLPFASVKALAADVTRLDREYRRLAYAHMQHHAIFEALANGQGARAESLMREHANATVAHVDFVWNEPRGVADA